MISLIIPTLNEEKYIRKTLQCLQELRKNKIIEIIIVDGLSQDNTLALSRDLCDKVISVKPGRADQLNAGALKANNNLLLFIHADTIVNPENIYELLRKYEKIEWGYFHLGFRTRAFKFKLLSYCINLRSTLFKYATGDQCLFVKKKLFKNNIWFKKIYVAPRHNNQFAVGATEDEKGFEKFVTLDEIFYLSTSMWEYLPKIENFRFF